MSYAVEQKRRRKIISVYTRAPGFRNYDRHRLSHVTEERSLSEPPLPDNCHDDNINHAGPANGRDEEK